MTDVAGLLYMLIVFHEIRILFSIEDDVAAVPLRDHRVSYLHRGRQKTRKPGEYACSFAVFSSACYSAVWDG